MKVYSVLFLLLFALEGKAQQKARLNIIADADWEKTKLPCADILYADSLGYLCFLAGCEARVQVLINRYSLKGDTIIVQPFDFSSEEVFLDIIKTPSDNPEQQITFYGAEGKPITGIIDSSYMIKLITGRRDKIINHTGTSAIKLPRGQYSGVEVMKLEMIFGVPVVFWIDRAYDYKVRINVPAYVLNNFILSCFNFKTKFLLKDKEAIYYQRKKLKIRPGLAATIPSPSF